MYGLHNISHGESSLRTESQETAKIAASKLSGWIVEKFSVMISSLSVKSDSRGSFYSSPLAVGRNWTSPHSPHCFRRTLNAQTFPNYNMDYWILLYFSTWWEIETSFKKTKIRVDCNDSKLRMGSNFFQFHAAISSWDQRWSRISKM